MMGYYGASHYVAAGGAAFNPTSIANLRQWMEPASLVGSDGDPISAWPGSGSTPGMNQTDTTKQPTLIIDGGVPAARFSAHYLHNTTLRGLGTSQTIFVVSRSFTTSSTDKVTYGVNSGTGVALSHRPGQAGARLYAHGGDWAAAAAADVPLGQWAVRSGRYVRGVSVESRVNAGAISFTSTTTGSTLDRYNQMGANAASSYYNGDIREVIHYSAALSDTEYLSVVNYLMQKWGIS